jgi:hypothetical protein
MVRHETIQKVFRIGVYPGVILATIIPFGYNYFILLFIITARSKPLMNCLYQIIKPKWSLDDDQDFNQSHKTLQVDHADNLVCFGHGVGTVRTEPAKLVGDLGGGNFPGSDQHQSRIIESITAVE